MDEATPRQFDIDPRLTARWQSLVDILYVSQVTFLYIFSAIYPIVGIVFGALFLAGSLSAGGKKVGRVCLILGIINTVLVIVFLSVFMALGLAGALSGIGKG
ncbi:MAG TPA: hypothetical protein VMH22_02535 [bacterium]|nr:hypothetical protein [bacterium]